ncbi:MAG: hypothetical protein QM765_06040 [Myxococcales bacterium]
MKTKSAALLVALLAGAAPVHAQDAAGTIALKRFRVVHTARTGGPATSLSRTLEDERNAIAAMLGRDWEGSVDVFVAEGPDDAQALGPLPQDAILLDSRSLAGEEGKQVLRHALAHLAIARLGTFPRWFAEGFAAIAADEWSASSWIAGYRSSVRPEAAIPLQLLTTSWPERLSELEVAHAQSLSFVAFLQEEADESALRVLVGKVAGGAAFEPAFREVFQTDLSAMEARWREQQSGRWSWVPVATHPMTLWVAFTVACVLGYVRIKHRRRVRQAEVELEEQARDAALRIAAAEHRRPNPTPVGVDDDHHRRPPTKPVLH